MQFFFIIHKNLLLINCVKFIRNIYLFLELNLQETTILDDPYWINKSTFVPETLKISEQNLKAYWSNNLDC